MTPDRILELRPVNGSAVAHREALVRADILLAEVDAELVVAQAARDDALLSADPAELTVKERKLTAARNAAADMRERVASVKVQLQLRLETATQTEAVASVNAAKEAAEASGRALVEWWTSSQEGLAVVLGQGQALDEACYHAWAAHGRAVRAAKDVMPDADFPHPQPTANGAIGWEDAVATMTQAPPKPYVPAPVDPEEEQRLAEVAEARRISTEEYRRQNNYGLYPVHQV